MSKMHSKFHQAHSASMAHGNADPDNDSDAGSFEGKSMELGEGGRAAKLKAEGVPGGVIGDIARSKGAAPGQPNYHRGRK